MTGRVSAFGSLGDRSRHERAPEVPTRPIRHAWLDETTPVLLVRWRSTQHGSWEGLVLGASADGPAMTWVRADRLRPVEGAMG